MVVRMKPQVDGTINLKPGCYNVTLQEPFEVVINGQRVIRFPFTVDGIRAKTNPYYFYLFIPKDNDDQSRVGRFEALSKSISECFNVKLQFVKYDYKLIKGRKGRVVIGYCKNGKMGVVFFMRNQLLIFTRKALFEDKRTFKNELL